MRRQLRGCRPEIGYLLLTLLLPILLALAACGGDPAPPPTPTPIPPTPTPDPAAVVRQAGEVMSELESVTFDIQRSGGPAFIDAERLFALNQAQGIYRAPDAVAADLDLSGPGLNLKIKTVAIGEEQWLTNFLTQQWEKLPPGFGFNPAMIFSQESGLEALLDENVVDVSPLREVTLEGKDFYEVDVTVEGDRVRAVTAGAAASDTPVTLALRIERATSFVHEVSFTTDSPVGDEPSQWALRFSGFNEPVMIEPPVTPSG